jgi:2-dehydro-3-deoxyphosphogluconate aldolase/(4S)-4-hydroxy-2-oxoglutarate aldolase
MRVKKKTRAAVSKGASRWLAHAEAAVKGIAAQRVIAVIREKTREDALFCAEAAFAGGIGCLELTFGSYDVPALVAEARRRLPRAHVGVGTTTTVAELEAAAAAGAAFAVSPHLDEELVQVAGRLGIAAIPGTMTPSEIMRAQKAGARLVKVFPVGALGGAQYVRQVLSPLPHVRLITTGGVRLANASELVQAGAIAVGAATDLFQPAWVAARDAASVRGQAQRYLTAVGAGR